SVGKYAGGSGGGHQRTVLNCLSGYQAVHVNQQNQAAIGSDRGSRKHLDVAQVFAQVFDDDFILAHHIFHHQPNLPAGSSDTHHAVVTVDGLDGIQTHCPIQTHYFGDLVADFGEHFAADFFQVNGFEAANLFNERQGQGKHRGSAAHKQGLRDDKRERNFEREPRAAALLGFHFDFAVELREIGADHVQPNAAPGKLGLARGGGEAWLEQHVQALALGHFMGAVQGGQSVLHGGPAYLVEIDPAAVVFNLDINVVAAMVGAHGNVSVIGFARQVAVFLALQPVGRGVAHQVDQR